MCILTVAAAPKNKENKKHIKNNSNKLQANIKILLVFVSKVLTLESFTYFSAETQNAVDDDDRKWVTSKV